MDRSVGEPGWRCGQELGEMRKQSKNSAWSYGSRSPGGVASRGLACAAPDPDTAALEITYSPDIRVPCP